MNSKTDVIRGSAATDCSLVVGINDQTEWNQSIQAMQDDVEFEPLKDFLEQLKEPVRTAKDRPWSEYPIGTKAHAFNGGHWLRVENGWKWHTGDTFSTPGGDAIGRCVELPRTCRMADDLPGSF